MISHRRTHPLRSAFVNVILLGLFLVPRLGVAQNSADWIIDLDTSGAGPGAPLSRALLGHYDLSGELFAYDQEPGLVSRMTAVGFSDWRVGTGRWEASTQLLPALTNGTPCPIPIPESAAPAGADDLALIAARDWFTDDGSAVSLADTLDDSRYDLDYFRSVLDAVGAFGATPFVSIDNMPRALAVHRLANRTDCQWTFENQVSNVRPANSAIFASAVTGLVERIIEGSGNTPGRIVTHWEVWNEPEFHQFWDPAFEDLAGPLDRYFEMSINSLVALDNYRSTSSHPNADLLRFGLGSFGTSGVAAGTLAAFDTAPLPMGFVPLDFISFHGYSDDPLDIVTAIDTVAAAAANTANYTDIELVLAEWGPDLTTSSGDPVYAASMAPALHIATVIALGSAVGLDRAHRAIFWDFYPNSIRLGLLDHDMNVRPAYRAYQLLARMLSDDPTRLSPTGLSDGRLDAGLGAVLATRSMTGTTRVLLVNRNLVDRSAEVRLYGSPAIPTRILRYEDPTAAIVEEPGTVSSLVVPAQSLLLLEFDAIPVPTHASQGSFDLLATVVLALLVLGSIQLLPRLSRRSSVRD